jgi:hypothetical protein
MESNYWRSVTKAKHISDWPEQHPQGKATSTIYRDPAPEEWIPERAALHENIIADLLAGKSGKKNPTLWVVTGGVGSALIGSELALAEF